MPEKIYLDFNATTPVLPHVMEAVCRVMKEDWGNPSSGHEIGKRAATALEGAREKAASCIGAAPDEVIFTSGGTESNNMAVIGSAEALKEKGRHLITTRIEHPSVLNPFIHLMEKGWEVDFAEPDSQGVVSCEAVERLLRPDTVFVSVMLANNETGAIQPIRKIAASCRSRGIRMHTDAAQAVGKIPVDVRDIDVDLLTVAGHKLYAPKGIGALFVRKGLPLGNIIFGAGQERGLRPGTEAVSLACGLGAACSWLKERILDLSGQMTGLRDQLYYLLKKGWPELVRFVPLENSLPNTLCVSFPGISGHDILDKAQDVMASTGAACHDRSIRISHVLAAMKVDEKTALGMIRLSLGCVTTEEEIRRAASSILQAAGSLGKKGK